MMKNNNENNNDLEQLVNGQVRVTLDLYSGMMNPNWKLSKKNISELRKKLKQVTKTDPTEQLKLGYRGFLIESKGVKGVPQNYVVYGNEALEKWLLDTAKTEKKKLSYSLKEYVIGEIEKRPFWPF